MYEYEARYRADERLRRRLWILLWVATGIFAGGFIATLAVSEAWAHSWYSNTRDPETGLSCCGGRDCQPIPEEAVKIDRVSGGWRYLPTGELIPFSRAQQSRDFQFHRCEYLSSFTNSQGSFNKGDTRCFFVPGGTS